jgi:hypothetical protein
MMPSINLSAEGAIHFAREIALAGCFESRFQRLRRRLLSIELLGRCPRLELTRAFGAEIVLRSLGTR